MTDTRVSYTTLEVLRVAASADINTKVSRSVIEILRSVDAGSNETHVSSVVIEVLRSVAGVGSGRRRPLYVIS